MTVKKSFIGRLEIGVKLVTLYVEGPQFLATLIYSVAQQPTRPFFLHFFSADDRKLCIITIICALVPNDV